ncbi:hypothetical protein C0991_008704 [Blastosporella zonata]|nr:hypothetical protein C0991_008704 [Blastosporella zonata]
MVSTLLPKVIVVLLSLSISQLSATSVPSSRDVLKPLLTRQTGLTDVPTETCTTTACLCTTSNANLLEACVDCIVGIDPVPAIISSAQTVLDDFSQSCAGNSVPSLTVSVTGGVPTTSTALATGGSTTDFVITTSPSTDTTSAVIAPAASTTSISQITVTAQAAATSSTSSSFAPPSGSGAIGLSVARNGIFGVSVGLVAGVVMGLL